MSGVRRGLVYALSDRYLQIAIQLAGMMLIARLLTPEEIGAYSVSAAFIGIAQVLREFGVGNYVVQEPDLTDDHVRTAIGFSLVIGTTLFTVTQLAASAIGDFYSSESLVTTVRILALNFLILPFCSISSALLRREMQFGRLAIVHVTSTLVFLIVSVSLAFSGSGQDSLAIASVASSVAVGIVAWRLRQTRKVLRPGFRQWRPMLRFGMHSSTANIVGSVGMNANDLVLGRVLGLAPVAVLSRAQGLMNLFHRDVMASVRAVALPVFARSRRDPELLDHQFVNAVTFLTAFAWPFYAFAALYSEELILFFFGDQWLEATPLVPWFCMAGALAATFSLIPDTVTAAGRIDLVSKSEVVIQSLRILTIASAAIYYKTLLACAIAFFVAFVAIAPIFYWIKSRCVPTDTALLFRGLVSSAAVTLMTISATYLVAAEILSVVPVLAPVFKLAIVGAVFAVAWTGSMVLFHHPLVQDPMFVKLASRVPVLGSLIHQ